MIVTVTGSRDWRYRGFVYNRMSKLYTMLGPFKLYHGDCRDRNGNPCGADSHANDWALEWIGEENIRRFPADWDRFGNRAGPIRNREMVQAALAAEPLDQIRGEAFRRDGSRGTQHTIDLMKAAKIEHKIWGEEDV